MPERSVTVTGVPGLTMYQWVYWSGITLLVAWTAFSAYSALSGM
jgi:hypothetical protein